MTDAKETRPFFPGICRQYCSLPLLKTILFLIILLGPFFVYGCYPVDETIQENNETVEPVNESPQAIDPGLDLFGKEEVLPPGLPG
ncbi:hypothetical protein HYW21_04135 [Candidatus Woesearchaeota archaeon]|nr:hypothetical protein [Candidatus Woesearchaeota archaeon]